MLSGENRLFPAALCISVLATSMISTTYASGGSFHGTSMFHEHEIEYCQNGDGTHFVYCTDGDCTYERDEACVDIDGICPYCGYEFPIDEEEYEEYVPEAETGEKRTYFEPEEEYEADDALSYEPEPLWVPEVTAGINTGWYDFTPADIKTLAQLMHHEAGNQCEEGKIAVVEVVLNRMASPKFKQNTVNGIVYAPGQFSYVSRISGITPSDYEIQLVCDVVSGAKRVFNDGNVLFFRNSMITSGIPTSQPVNWGSHQYATYIQDHAFYYG